MNREEIENIIQEGESYKIEFKESVDKTFVEEVCAFANASGGRLFIGISDSGTIVGTDTSNSARSRIQDTIRQIQPEIHCEMNIFQNIIILSVSEGNEKPYSCSKGFFLRVGPNSQKLDRNKIVSFVQAEGRVRFDEFVKQDIDIERTLDRKIFDRYLSLGKISNVLPANEILINLNCAVENINAIHFNNAGILFFASNPMKYIPQAQVICALYKSSGK